MGIYRYLLISITIFALYQMLFFYLIRPYYLKKLGKKGAKSKVPEVAFEVVYLMILILGLAVAPLVNITPYLLWGVILLVYGLAIRFSDQSFFLASALLFKIHRNLGMNKQLRYQDNIIFSVCIISSLSFLTASFFLKA